MDMNRLFEQRPQTRIVGNDMKSDSDLGFKSEVKSVLESYSANGVDVPFDVIEHLPVAGEDGVLEGHQIAGEKIRGDLKEHSLDLAGALNAVEREAADAVELLNDFRSHFPLHVREAEEDFGEGKQLQIVMKRIEAGTGPEMERDRHSGAEEEEISRLHRQFAAEHRRADGGPRSFRGKNRKDPVERIGVDRAAVEIRPRVLVEFHREQIGVVGLLRKVKWSIHKIASFFMFFYIAVFHFLRYNIHGIAKSKITEEKIFQPFLKGIKQMKTFFPPQKFVEQFFYAY